MKKVLTLLAVSALVGLVACSKPTPTPTPEPKPDPQPEKKDPVTATITASDVTVEEGKTVQIEASTNSSATITFESADQAIATVAADGTVTGVKAGNTTVTLKVAEVKDEFTAAEKTINVSVTAAEVVPPEIKTITIDGDFSDWSELEAGTFAKSVSDPDAPWEGVKEIRCYAIAETVFWYIKFDEESLAEAFEMEPNDMHLRLCINTDGEYESGYKKYFLEGYDFIIEGTFAQDAAFVDFDGEFHQMIGGSWESLLGPENGLVWGKGAGVEYEIAMDRATFNAAANTSPVPMSMGDDFQTGIRFYYNGWAEFSNVPNSSIEEEQGNGWGYLMRVHTQK